MKLFEKADDVMKDLGYTLIEENKFGASYIRREISSDGSSTFVHQIDLVRPTPDEYYVFSYEKRLNSDQFVRLSHLEIEALRKKYREIHRKYRRM